MVVSSELMNVGMGRGEGSGGLGGFGGFGAGSMRWAGGERMEGRWWEMSQYRWLHRVGDLGCLGRGEVRRVVVNARSARRVC